MTYLEIGGITALLALGLIKTVELLVAMTERVDSWRAERMRNRLRRIELPRAIWRQP